jgi:prepilin-type processing-associated H-X9-DG protein
MRLLAEQLETRRQIADDDLKRIRVLQCPSHPVEGIPTAFTINAYAFETRPNWAPDGPIKLVQPRRHSELPWILESSDTMPGVDSGGTVPELIFGIQFHDAWEPSHLPRQSGQRISDNRHHGRTANVLYLDGHVGLIRQGELVLEMLDDGVRKRATPFPPTLLRPDVR